MTDSKVSTRTLIAVLVAISAALIFRSWLQVELREDGWTARYAADLSYLVVPPTLLLLLFPLWRSQKANLESQFRLSALTWAMVLRAVAIGCLLRLFSWGYLITSVAFGWQQNSDPRAIVGPDFSFQCGSPTQVILGVVVMVLMVPAIEECIHRGVTISYLRRHGALLAIVLSAVLFMVFHPMSSWHFVFIAGLVLGYQYWHSGLLWPSLFSHMTVNGLIQLDWYCLTGNWNPDATDLPLLIPSILGITLVLASLLGVLALLPTYKRGAI